MGLLDKITHHGEHQGGPPHEGQQGPPHGGQHGGQQQNGPPQGQQGGFGGGPPQGGQQFGGPMAREKRSTATYDKSYQEKAQGNDDDEQPVASGSRERHTHADDDFDDADEDLAPAKKKAKRAGATTGKGKGRVGKLAKFNSMPLDVLSEICSHLDPLSLLYMSRTTKSIHRLLTSKGSRALWISARRTVALPDLSAEDMTEMAYASLVFERNCMVCGKGRASKHDYAIRARFCSKCAKKNVLYGPKVERAIPDRHPLALTCSPATPLSPNHRWPTQRNYYFIPGVKIISDLLYTLEAEHDQILSEREDAKPAKSKKGKGKGKAKTLDQDASSPEDSKDTPYTLYIRSKQANVAVAREDAQLIKKWETTTVKDRKLAARDASKQRTAAIDAKMVALGYELQDVQAIYSSIYSDGKALTDRIWKNIAPQIMAAADQKKTHRLERESQGRRWERKQLIDPLHKSILDAWPISKLNFPSVYEFYEFPSIKGFWDPEGAEIKDAAWNAALPTIHTEIRKHQAKMKRKYFSHLGLILHAAGSPLDSKLITITKLDAPSRGFAHKATVNAGVTNAEMDAVFARFSSRFLCCKSLLPYKEMVAHRKTAHHVTGPDAYANSTGAQPNDEVSSLSVLLSRLEQEGLDETTTDAHLEKAGPVFECHDCPSAKPKAPVPHPWGGQYPTRAPEKTTQLLWSEALRHQVGVHLRVNYRFGPELKYSARIKRMIKEEDTEEDAVDAHEPPHLA
ncbi:hypothetical protein RQP46_006316 [Phenoliferia psychrophenolica]